MFETLTTLVPPPENPVNTDSASAWDSVIAEIKQDLPHELFLLSSTYGSGHFVQGDFWIQIHSVFRPGFALMVEFNRRIFQQEAVRSPDPYAHLFELGAYSFGGDQGSMGRIFWDTSGEIDDWKIGLSWPLQRFSLSLIDFLTESFSNRISPKGFPDSFDAITFIPWEASADSE
ncbi:MAG: hypothetical protein JWP89_2993 [Schlesneria sp.]|nr:hypothetical protein [Schlesneria sp.]